MFFLTNLCYRESSKDVSVKDRKGNVLPDGDLPQGPPSASMPSSASELPSASRPQRPVPPSRNKRQKEKAANGGGGRGGFAWRGWRLLVWSVEKGWRGKARGGGERRHGGTGESAGRPWKGVVGRVVGAAVRRGLTGRGREDSGIGPAVERGALGALRRHRLPRSLRGAGLCVAKGVHIWAGPRGALWFMWVTNG